MRIPILWKWGDIVKLDHNCVRDVLLYLESVPYVKTNLDGDVEFTGVWLDSICDALPKYSKEVIFYTLFELNDGEYVSLSEGYAEDALENCCVNYITYAGHEFLNTIRADPTWEKTLKIAGHIGNFGLQMLTKIAEGIATAYLKQQLGLL